jgi:hypothetical protein
MSFLYKLNIPEWLIDLINKPLSSKDIKKYIPKCNIVRYIDLFQYDTIDQLLGPIGICFILYHSSINFGHWVLLSRRDNNTLEFFDSYGSSLDDILEKTDFEHGAQFNKETGIKSLSILIASSKYNTIINNSTQLQYKDNNVQTCGRHCIARVMFNQMDLDEYVKMFLLMDLKMRDIFVTMSVK